MNISISSGLNKKENEDDINRLTQMVREYRDVYDPVNILTNSSTHLYNAYIAVILFGVLMTGCTSTAKKIAELESVEEHHRTEEQWLKLAELYENENREPHEIRSLLFEALQYCSNNKNINEKLDSYLSNAPTVDISPGSYEGRLAMRFDIEPLTEKQELYVTLNCDENITLEKITILSNDVDFSEDNVFTDCPKLTLYGYEGSTTNIYAAENNIPFSALDNTTIVSNNIAYASEQAVTLDGNTVIFQMYALKDSNGNFTNYIKLRDLAYMLNRTNAQYNVAWDGVINLEAGVPYTSANGSEFQNPFSGDRVYQINTVPIRINGVEINIDAFVLNDDDGGGYTYFKLRDLGKALGFNVSWDDETGIYVETDQPYSDEN